MVTVRAERPFGIRHRVTQATLGTFGIGFRILDIGEAVEYE